MVPVASKDDFTGDSNQTTERVVFPGLPVNVMGHAKNYPIIRSGAIAPVSEALVPLLASERLRLTRCRSAFMWPSGTAGGRRTPDRDIHGQ
jgi:hypothetical protein